LSALNGEWKLVYTSNSELLAILALSKLPFVTIGDITQRVDVLNNTVENKVWGAPVPRGAGEARLQQRSSFCPTAHQLRRSPDASSAREGIRHAPDKVCCRGCALTVRRPATSCPTIHNLKAQISVPLSRTAVSTTASFEVRSPKRLAIRFERGAIATPQLLSDLSIPDSISVLGQSVDLTAVRGLLQPVESGLSGLISSVGSLISQQPDLSFPLPGAAGERGETWLLTTYLDDDTRITRWLARGRGCCVHACACARLRVWGCCLYAYVHVCVCV
jgi:hypothetical protein